MPAVGYHTFMAVSERFLLLYASSQTFYGHVYCCDNRSACARLLHNTMAQNVDALQLQYNDAFKHYLLVSQFEYQIDNICANQSAKVIVCVA
jgi:hypothetical protein